MAIAEFSKFVGVLGAAPKVPAKLWTEIRDIVQEAVIFFLTTKKKKCKKKEKEMQEMQVITTTPKKKKCKKWLSEEALQIAEKRREVKGTGEKKRYTHQNAVFQRRQGEIRKPTSVISAKK